MLYPSFIPRFVLTKVSQQLEVIVERRRITLKPLLEPSVLKVKDHLEILVMKHKVLISQVALWPKQ